MFPTFVGQDVVSIALDERTPATDTRAAPARVTSRVSGETPGNVSLTYRPSPALRQADLAKFARQMPTSGPAFQRAMLETRPGRDVIALVDARLRPLGLSSSDIADATTIYWMSAWAAARGDIAFQPSRAQAQAVRSQVARGLTRLAPVVTSSDAKSRS